MRKGGREGGKQDRTKHITSTFNDRSTGSCICVRLDLYMLHGNKIQPVRVEMICITCNMYKSSLRHIHDPVLLSLKVEVICFVFRNSWGCSAPSSFFVVSLAPFKRVISQYHTTGRSRYL